MPNAPFPPNTNISKKPSTRICPLASGSKGNCTYIETDEAKILIDGGLSGKATAEKLAQIGVSLDDIDAILVTHEHGDHIRGLKVLAYKRGIPIFANAGTAQGIMEEFHEKPKLKIFTTGETFEFADMEIHPFSIQHDTMDPVAFTITTKGIKIGICTDLGFVTTLVKGRLKNCDILILEANHQESMVHACSRPLVYKQRVLGRSGHLSNAAAGALLADIAHEGLQRVYLAHLSSECNTPDVAMDVIGNILESHGIKLEMTIAHQDRVSLVSHF